MKIKKIDFPKPLLNALRDGELVVFAGAGVSMGPPACLPGFAKLADMVAEGTGKTLQEGEPTDRFLGRLQHAGVNVHALAKKFLPEEGRKATELHQNLLRIYSNVAQVRIVTTNFDLLFEKASKAVLDDKLEVFRAPALPLGRQFNGIVHVHGAVSHPDEMVLTDADFGRAYLTEGWARRFLSELFRNFSVLFVGYSHNDAILSYLARALPVSEKARFALIGEKGEDPDRWRMLGIEPISYPQSNEKDHSILDAGVRGLANLVRHSVLDWQREITEIAQKPPPLEEETVDLIEDALGDKTRTRFFTEAASDPKWIDWLDKREYLDALFDDGVLSERDKILSKWLAEKFAYDHADTLFLLIGKHGMGLHPKLWSDLERKIWTDENVSLDRDILSRWISLLLTNVPADRTSQVSLCFIGEYCIKRDMLDCLLQIFNAIAKSRLTLEKGFTWPDNDADDAKAPIDVKLPMIGDHYNLNKLWENGLKPKLSQIARPLFERITRCLEERYLTFHAWQNTSCKWERESYSRSAIEPHEQDWHPRSVDVLIDAARDCLEWLIKNQADEAAHWCIRLADSEVPLFRRLAVHGLSERKDLTADEKIDWLLKHIDLHDLSVHHEVFRAVRLAYPQASPKRRKNLIKTVRTYRWPKEEDPERESRTAYQHFNWFHWLHKSDPNCTLAKQALGAVLAAYPDFKPSGYPDFTHWSSPVQDVVMQGPTAEELLQDVVMQGPWAVEELLAKSAADWVSDLLSFQGTEPLGRGLRTDVAEAAKQNFDWGLDLADALAENGEWDVHFWSNLIETWSGMALDEDQYRKVLHRLGKAELYPEHNRAISDVLYALVKDDGVSYALNLLPQANKIAAALWHHLDRTDQIEERDDWLQSAINHPAGRLALFWLKGFVLWRKQQDPAPTILSDEYRTVLSYILQDRKLPGRLGRTILASQVAFLLTVDEAWTKKNVLPLFDPDSDSFQAAWDGFLNWGNLNPALAEAMTDLFLKAVERLDSDLSGQRDRFIKYYTYMISHFAEAPIGRWIPKFFQGRSQEAKNHFALEVGYCLRDLDETAQREWWEHWLKQYWSNRLQSVPAGAVLEASEVEHMLGWLPHLTAVFPEAVGLAVQMPSITLQNYHLIHQLETGDLWQKYPEEVAKLLIHWGKCDLREDVWYSGTELVDKLLQSGISPELKQKLKEFRVRLP